MSDLNALVGIDFSLIGTKLHAAYEKKGNNGYAVLLAPTVQEADSGVSIGAVIKDIKKLVAQSGTGASTDDMEKDLTDSLSGMNKDGLSLDNIFVKLNMAYLYISKGEPEDSDSILEYAFQLQIVTEGFVPEAIKTLVDVQNISLSVWNTSRKVVIDKMQLVTIDQYIGTSPVLNG